jgi:hypothetical protein
MPKNNDVGEKMRAAVEKGAHATPFVMLGDAMAKGGQMVMDAADAVKRKVAPLLPGAGPKKTAQGTKR